jgi:cytochrome c biogenesis protein CcmG, thiol:disulfide interchange protein DsbE
MKKIGLWASALLFASLIVGCGPKSGGPSDPSDKVGEEPGASGSSDKAEKGKPAPEIEAEAVTGDGPKSIAEAKGTVTIVDFWATFCDPCRKSFPKYQELVDKHAGKLAVIAVSVDDPEDVGVDEVKKFADDLGVSFAIVWDKQKKTSKKYDPPKMPTSYLLDKDGNIVSVHPGFEGGEAEKIDAEIEDLISK